MSETWFDTLGLDDVPLVGGKNASLGELRGRSCRSGGARPRRLRHHGGAYRAFLRGAGLEAVIEGALAGWTSATWTACARRGGPIRTALLAAELPAPLAEAVRAGYRELEAEHGAGCDVAVRSSATAEDLPEASFAGQQETYLNVRGETALLDAVRRCFASLFTDRAIVYRAERGFAHGEVALSVGVQKMVRSDLGGAGVMFSLDTESGFRDVVLINAAWGLGESVVQGTVNPDEYTSSSRPAGGLPPHPAAAGWAPRSSSSSTTRGDPPVRSVPVPRRSARGWCWARRRSSPWRAGLPGGGPLLRGHGAPTPMDMEWAKDGRTGELFLLQARPETVHARAEDGLVLERHVLDAAGEVLARDGAWASGSAPGWRG
jgi:pyruvate, water dikinase